MQAWLWQVHEDFFFLYFSIPMLKNPMELSTLQVYNISHFFFLCKLNLTWRTQEEKKKNLALFSFYLRRDGWRGSEGGSWEKRATQQAPKSKIKKKKIQTKTHTQKMEHQLMNWRRNRKKKKICKWCRLQRWAWRTLLRSLNIVQVGGGGVCKKTKTKTKKQASKLWRISDWQSMSQTSIPSPI